MESRPKTIPLASGIDFTGVEREDQLFLDIERQLVKLFVESTPAYRINNGHNRKLK